MNAMLELTPLATVQQQGRSRDDTTLGGASYCTAIDHVLSTFVGVAPRVEGGKKKNQSCLVLSQMCQ